MTTTVAIISDTHAFLDPRIEALVEQADMAIHAGDICACEILDEMRPKSGKVVAVAGNNDHSLRCMQENLDSPKQLPDIESLALPGGVVKIEHGHRHDMHKPAHSDLRAAHPEARLVVYGHTHKLVVDQDESTWVVNPGAAGQTRTGGGPSCLILTASETQWSIKPFKFSDD